jgi:amino acid adenylation domain-containing protein
MARSRAVWSSVVQGLEAQAIKTPDLVAVECGGEGLSYRALNRRANHLGFFLKAMGVKSDVVVGICLPRSLDMAVALLGTLKAGGAYLPLDPQYPTDRLDFMLAESRPAVLLGHSQFLSHLPGVDAPVVLLDADVPRSEREDAPAPNARPDALTYIIYTSGSTGRPKGVAMEQGALLNLLAWQVAHSSCGLADRTLQLAPLSFDVSFQEIFSTWLSGGTLVLTDEESRTDPARLLGHLVTAGVRRLFLPYLALQQLAEVAIRRGPLPMALREVVTSGEPLRITRQIAELFHKLPLCRLENQYGPSETHVITAHTLSGPPDEWPVLPPIGRALPNVRLAILNEAGRPVEPGDQGELYVGGVALARGYWSQPELTQQGFVPDPQNPDARLCRTGDLVKERADGELEFLGRSGDQIKLRGHRIELGTIEVALSQHPDVAQAAVAVREHPGHKRLVAYLVGVEGRSPRPQEVRRHLQARLPELMVPATFVMLADLPRTPSGKVDRHALPQPGHERPLLDVEFEPPRGHEEETIAQIWARLLDIDQVGAHDNFFDLGGTSLLAVQSVLDLREALGRDVPVIKLFQYPNVRALAGSLAGGGKASGFGLQASGQSTGVAKEARDHAQRAVALIGMAGRFPGARNLEELWRNLRAGRETITFFSPEELDPGVNGSQPGYVAARGVLEDADKFDSAFFNEAPRLADITDPQQRVFLEVAWQALEDAGVVPGQADQSVGVFAGVGNNSYQWANLANRPDITEPVGSFQIMLGNEKDYVALRVAHKLDLHGPALSVHTACSTSLVAVCMAVRSLLDGECDVALAGGASVTCPQNSGHVYNEGGLLSADGHTRCFDAQGTGTVFSDGAGAVVCKRLDDALADGDRIYAVIHGVATNNDGAGKANFTAPSVAGQAQAISAALAMAGFHPESIGAIEAHGTATPLGDPIEVEALTEVFRARTDKQGFCSLGSIKSNLGHMTAAAGVAGLIKTALALHHRELPPSLHFQPPNPHIDLQHSPFKVQTTLQRWTPLPGQPRRAGVSSFGMGGSNAHVVLQEAPTPPPTGPGLPSQLLLISAKQAAVLETATTNLGWHLVEHPEQDLAEVAYTLQTRRAAFACRRFVLGRDHVNASQALLRLPPEDSQTHKLDGSHPEVAFLFPGQGSQHADMARALYQDEPVVRGVIDVCVEILSSHMERDLRALLFPQPGDRDEAARLLQQAEFAQPALFTVEYALAELWRSWGVVPSAMLGHSVGEYVAACLAGVFSLPDALALVAARGRLVQAQPGGSMLSVRAAASAIEARLYGGLSLAASNGPQLCVVSGPSPEVVDFQKQLEAENVLCRRLPTSHAFHSSMMDPVVEPFAALVSSLSLSAARVPFVSSTSGTWITPAQACDPGYWARQLREPVRFAEGIRTLWTDSERVLLEVGPRTAASTMARQSTKDPERQCVVATLGNDPGREADWRSLLRAMGRLWVHGVDIDWSAVHAGTQRRVVSLPPYPFERRRHWVEPGLHAWPGAPRVSVREPEAPAALGTAAPLSPREHLRRELRAFIESTSGSSLGEGEGMTFLDAGLDSLLLTKLAFSLQRKYRVELSFRQLLDGLSSLGPLTDYIFQHQPRYPAAARTVPVPLSTPESMAFEIPMTGARLGRDADGNPAWFVADPDRAGKYLRVEVK